MKIKILILAPVRLDGIDREPGEDAELDESLLNRWIELGYCKEIEKNDSIPPKQEQDKGSIFPKHKGFGVYELSNGEEVKGKGAASEAQNALKVGDTDETKNNNSTTN